MFSKPHDGLVLKLLWLEFRNGWNEVSLHDRLFLLISGSVCLLWPLNDLTDLLHRNAAYLRASDWVWVAALALWVMLGTGFGLSVAAMGLARAHAPYFKVLPTSEHMRRRMAAVAAIACCLGTAPVAGLTQAAGFDIIGKQGFLLWGCASSLAYLSGAGVGLTVRLWLRREEPDEFQPPTACRRIHLPLLPWLHVFDGAKPAWVSSWSIGMVAGQLPLSFPRSLGAIIIALAAVVPSVASLSRHKAGPAAAGAVLTGFAAFMLIVRCLPLRSPVLRTAPIGFMKAWFSMLRLPFLLSAVFFAIPAGAAIVAEPSSWTMSVGGCIAVLVLDGAYAIFAATFLMSPMLAAGSFVGLAIFASYEWVTYHAVVYFCCAILLALMAGRIRRTYYDGP